MTKVQRTYEGLLAAIVKQTIKDCQAKSKRLRREAASYLQSDDFGWAWEYLTEDILGMPDVHTARERILTTQISLNQQTYQTKYHTRRGISA